MELPREVPPRRLMALTFSIAVAWAAVNLAAGGRYHHAPFAEEAAIAWHLSQGHGFASPFDPSADAPGTTWSPPIYPLVIAGWSRLPGLDGEGLVMALAATNAVAFGVVVLAMQRLGWVYGGRGAGIVASLLTMAHPVLLHYVGSYWDSMLALSLFTVAAAVAATWSRAPVSVFRSGALGAMLGMLSLVNASYALSYPLLVLVATRATAGKRRIARCGAAFLAFVVVLTPWTARNHAVSGRLMYVRGGLPLELWLGNVPDSSGWWTLTTMRLHPFVDPLERQHLLEIGESAYFDLCAERFARDYRLAPAEFWKRTGRRIGFLLLGEPSERDGIRPFASEPHDDVYLDRVIVNALVAILGLAGAWYAWRVRTGAAWLLGAGLLSVAPFALVAVDERYALPLRAMLLACGALVLAALPTLVRRGRAKAPAAG